ncbi:hypothetical protein [Lactococcus lactis]|uniref:hypothetical protein n=1 Tax=Lactococcus lactis TaxID=1358 RepID=UPI00288D83C8|nr:hypothetical protein [Lactococcus lactis]MDT2909289.1 hypothetical protein [Lactococcus lactis]MDT2925181.1 hypothetical protein [Lactococcus lactis]MDT2952040.1 hypothetical protein [Lactococcus lactis]
MKYIGALTYYEQFKEQFSNHTGYPNQYELETLDEYLQLNSEFRVENNDVLPLLKSAFSYERDWNVIFSEANLNLAISEMIDYLNSTYLPAQVNWIDQMDEYHNYKVQLYFDPRTNMLHFKEVDTSYWAQYTNRIDCVTVGYGMSKSDLMNLLIRTNNDISIMKNYLKYMVYKGYAKTPEPPEVKDIFFEITTHKKILETAESKKYSSDFVVIVDTEDLSGKDILSDFKMTKNKVIGHFANEDEANKFAERFGYSDMSRHYVSGLIPNAVVYKRCYSFKYADDYITANIETTKFRLESIYKYYFFRLLEHHTQCNEEVKSLIDYAFKNLQLFSNEEKKHISNELTRLIEQTKHYIENNKEFAERYMDFKREIVHDISGMLSNL